MKSNPRVLAFTCSRNRPLMLRHCVIQMQLQNYDLDHAIFINYIDGERDNSSARDYFLFIKDVNIRNKNNIFLDYGKYADMHSNNLRAIELSDIDNYDLFLKIDDDDIYQSNYVHDVVEDYLRFGWDYSGSHSDGILNGSRWYPDDKKTDLGLSKKDVELGVIPIMPPTAAFSRRAIKKIMQLEPFDGFDDVGWRKHLAADNEMKCHVREKSNFIYNIHGANVSTGSWLED